MISFNNQTKNSIDAGVLHRVAKIVFQGENVLKEKEISVVFVSREKIKELNEKYRKKNGPTDVLSFEGENDFLGEIVICPEVVKEKKEELEFVLIHGILHLLGYDHELKEDEKEMQSKENNYLALCQKAI